MRFLSGEAIALREVWHGRVWKARPAIVVRDDEQLVLWTPEHTPMAIGDNGPVPPRTDDEWRLVPYDHHWDCLRIVGDHSLQLIWEGGAFRYSRINLETPFVRTDVGFDFQDLALDVHVHPDGTLTLEDEDHLEQMVERGLADGDRVRAEAERLVAAWPFPTGWEDWAPDPSWPVPNLPAGWDEL